MTTTTRDDGVRWLTEAEQAAWRAFLEMHARLIGQLGRELQDGGGLSMADFAVLVRLSEHPDACMRVLELARGLRWEKSRLSHQLTRMEQRGLVERVGCDEDRRGANVALTDAGRSALDDVAPVHVAGVRRYLFDGLEADDVAALHAIASATLERLDQNGAGDAAAAPCS